MIDGALLARRVREGDTDTFDEVFRVYHPRIYRHVYRMVGNPEEASDIVQESFLKAYRALSRGEEPMNLSAWLYRIASNTCMDVLRRRRLIRWQPLDDVLSTLHIAGGHATGASEQLWSATQPFEHGRMVWVDHLEEDHIYVLSYGEDDGSGIWQRYVDAFREGDPESAGFTSPQGMQELIRGFGKVWRNELGSRDAAIGWALAPEQGYVGEVQPFEHGVMLWCPLEGVIYVLLDDGGWTAHTTPR